MTVVADQLYLSYKLRGYSDMNMLRHWERLLRVFPFSKLSHTPNTLRVQAVSLREPVLLEQDFGNPIDLDAVVTAAREFMASDCAVQLEAKWDIWQYVGDWKLTPTRIVLASFGEQFEDKEDEHLRVDFGPDAMFLPDPELPGAGKMAESNLKSLLSFVHEADEILAVESRRLWTESGDNFAERLQAVVREQ
jgi:hypothetical protein